MNFGTQEFLSLPYSFTAIRTATPTSIGVAQTDQIFQSTTFLDGGTILHFRFTVGGSKSPLRTLTQTPERQRFIMRFGHRISRDPLDLEYLWEESPMTAVVGCYLMGY